MHTFFIWYPIYNPDKQSIPYTLNKWYTTLTSKLQKGLTELGNRSQRHYYSRRRPEKTCMKKKPFGGKNITGNLGRNHREKKAGRSPSYKASQLKQNNYSN